MNAGWLRHRMTIHTLPAGTTTTVWASIDHLGGNQHRIYCRWRDFDRRNFEQVQDDVTIKVHVTFGNRVFDITEINQDLKRQGQIVMVGEERVNSDD